ncbi:MAG: hypothetical protein WKF78_00700 [Candidatus Limnocylindrales bacterium]
MPVGVSADGSTIVLVEDLPATKWASATASRFAVVSRGGARATRIIELGGSFEFDALSPDGSRLYVAQHVPGPLQDRYQVRVVSTATGVMDEAIIVDKRNLDEAMAGRPISQFRRADGMVFTLYRGRSIRSSTPSIPWTPGPSASICRPRAWTTRPPVRTGVSRAPAAKRQPWRSTRRSGSRSRSTPPS